MKFGVREICDVFLKTKVANQIVGNKTVAKKGTPVCHFDTLKTSSVEGAATMVYAQGGKGNPRLVAWEGERTLTFTMEDALISTVGISLLTGAGLIESTSNDPLPMHVTIKDKAKEGKISLKDAVYIAEGDEDDYPIYYIALNDEGDPEGDFTELTGVSSGVSEITIPEGANGSYMIDYYTQKTAGLTQIDIEPDKFGGNYYLEASTLFRAQNGKDYEAEFIIPNCKIQSNFTFTMASSGDPSTFTYTIDAFPGVTKYNSAKKVLCAIQMFEDIPTASSSAKPFNYNEEI